MALFSQFQCRQCQDLLENNLAHKRPIEGKIYSASYDASILICPHSPGWEEES